MKNDLRKLDQKSQEKLRLQAIKYIKNGSTHLETAKFLGIKRQVISKWWSYYKLNGIQGLKMKSKANITDKSKVNIEQAKAVRKIILDKTPDQLNFGFMLWTREAVRQVLKRNYNVSIGLSAVGRLLKNMGLTPQKPMKKAYEQSSSKVRNWLKKEYPKIQVLAKKSRAEIQWGDEMGIRSDDQIGRTYGKKGQTPIVKVSGKRFRTNMISTITNRGKLRFMVFNERFTSSVFINFLKRLIKGVKNKIFLLPAYSPELNPDEYLNQNIKQHVRKRRPKDQNELVGNLRSFLKSRQKDPEKIKNLFKAEKVKYAA